VLLGADQAQGLRGHLEAHLAPQEPQRILMVLSKDVGDALHGGRGVDIAPQRITSQDGLGDFESGQRLLRRPSNRAEAGVGYRFGERASVRLEARFVGDRDDVDYTTFQRVTLHPYTRLDLMVDYEVLHPRGLAPGFAVNARLENLASDDAREIANFPARRRTLLFGGRVQFGS